MTTLARTRGASVVHTSSCASARNGTPWRWADTVTTTTVARAVTKYGMALCRRCSPLPAHARLALIHEATRQAVRTHLQELHP